MLLAVLVTCSQDPCTQACAVLSRNLNQCIVNDDWSLTWQDLGATSRTDFRDNCQDDWDRAQAELETRQSDAADDACEVVVADVPRMSCQELRALYVE